MMSLQLERFLLAYLSLYNASCVDMSVSSSTLHSFLLAAKSVNLVVAYDGFLCKTENDYIFIVTALIAAGVLVNLY